MIDSFFQEGTGPITNIALGKYAKIKTAWDSEKMGDKAVDGQVGTLVCSAKNTEMPIWFFVDLGARARINHTSIYNRKTGCEFVIYLSSSQPLSVA